MPSSRIYQNTPLTEQQTVALDPPASHHVLNVLRMRAGDKIALFNGDGREYCAALDINGKTVSATITGVLEPRRESPVHIALTQGISRGDHMDWSIQKAVELGVHRIVPVYCERSIRAPEQKRAEKKLQHWRGIVISACEQSGRCRLPRLETAKTLANHCATSNRLSTAYVLDPTAERSLIDALTKTSEAEILIGPEGGLTKGEIKTATKAGYQAVSLGPRILRTETAGVAALAIIQSRLGDLK